MIRRRWVMVVMMLSALAAGCDDIGVEMTEPERAPTTSTTPTATTPPATATTMPGPERLLVGFPAEDLVVAFFADAGVETQPDTSVASWTDVTGSITLESSGEAPTLIAGGLAGRDIVRFTSGGGPAVVADTEHPLPLGTTDRTLIVAGNWRPTCCDTDEQILGAGWGDPATENGNFFAGNVHLNCFTTNVLGVSTSPGAAPSTCGGQSNSGLVATDSTAYEAGFVTMAASIDRGALKLYLRDVLAREVSGHIFATVPGQFWIGTWPTGEKVGDFDVVAVLVYGRALTDEEIAVSVDVLRTEFGVGA